ncbi:M6 family metalloprotease domain-containing protein [Aquincola sp. S2]|uniref:M6 family metalloprotease domain-containing protein n=1 Tax=Pseudaquabacterium terrae TaxID=2732868 RepID=A0ABX2EAF5_9BURK|nr:M6 family metalloprotease domain-containing protein [Aquabacterium terrae]NRF66049.1 M6 family metalloprotease domain-containing protein [Aquabacterium terrae]
MATPFSGKQFTFTQPDGSTIQLRGWGDQHYAVFETTDGYTVTRNPATGFYEVAQLSDDGERLEPAPGPLGHLDGAAAAVPRGLRIRRDAAHARGIEGMQRLGGRRCDQRREERRAQRRAMRALAAAGGPVFAPPQRATVGDFVGLCLLIDFADEPGTITREEVERFCNQPGYSGFGNHGSVRDYFFDNSIGRCRYTNIVAPYYRALHPKSFYTDRNIEQGVRARQLILEALNHLKGQGFDFAGLTPDSAGLVYAMNVYYAGEVVNNWAEGLWPHAWHLASAVPLAPGRSAFDYQFTDMSQQLALGTFCHENGHMLCDYPDLYDYGNESSGVGAYCLMCAGSHATEKNPAHVSAYLKRLSGWAGSVTNLEHGQQLTLEAGANQFAMYAKNSDEYFLIENRAKAGRDAGLPDEGLAIWHIDEGGDNSNELMTPASHYELSLEQADGAFALERQRGGLGDGTDLFGQVAKRFADTTTPSSKWWDGSASRLDIHAISAPGGQMSFRVALGDVVVPPQVLQKSSAPDRAVPDNQGLGITDVIEVAESVVFASLTIAVDISHSYRGDLRVRLMAPWGETIVLHPKGVGGNADDLKLVFDEATLPALAAWRGRNAQGTWRLTVQDLAPADNGRLNRWALQFAAATPPAGPVTLQEAPGTHIPDDDAVGIHRTLHSPAAGVIGAIEVTLDIAHSFIGDLRVLLISPAGSEVVLHDGIGGATDNIVKTYTAATTPGLAALAGEGMAGDWELRIADLARLDIGKLNAWKLVLQPAL